MAEELRNAYGKTLAKLVAENENIVVLDADLSKSTKTYEAKKVAPERHFNAGIAEANMIGMAAGLAASGKTVFASSFAIFAAGRAFEIIRNSVCYPHLNVKVCASHAGLCVGEDGASHQAIEDIAIMRSLPNMQVFVPSDALEAAAIIEHVAKIDGPCYVRMGRGKVEDVYAEGHQFNIGKADLLKKGSKVCLFATGLMVQEAIKASETLKESGLDVSICNISCLKPLDVEGVLNIAKEHEYCFALEEHNIMGGFFSTLAEALIPYNVTKLFPIGVNDTFGESGKSKDVLNKYGICADHIVEVVKATVR